MCCGELEYYTSSTTLPFLQHSSLPLLLTHVHTCGALERSFLKDFFLPTLFSFFTCPESSPNVRASKDKSVSPSPLLGVEAMALTKDNDQQQSRTRVTPRTRGGTRDRRQTNTRNARTVARPIFGNLPRTSSRNSAHSLSPSHQTVLI